jgi:hypothetical protein
MQMTNSKLVGAAFVAFQFGNAAAAVAAAAAATACHADNLVRCLIASPSLAIPYCSSSVDILVTPATSYVTSTPTT